MKLEIKNIKKSFGKGNLILDNISLTIEDGEFVVFLGPSGCGKTTLLRIIAGLEDEDSGDIFFDGVRINDYEPKDRNIGMVFQNYALYPHLSVFDNVAFPLKISKMSKKDIRAKVEEIAKFIGLSDYLNYLPKQLSGGQKQRVALGRAISRSPKLFLFDEPLSNLDAKLRSVLRTDLYKLHRKFLSTSIYVTHDQVEAMTMGDKIVILNHGVIQQVGSPLEVYENPSNLFVATFIGNPQINLFDAIFRNENLEVYDNSGATIVRIPFPEVLRSSLQEGAKVMLGIRPEHFSLEPLPSNSCFFAEEKIYSTEFIGNETFLHFRYNDELRTLRITGHSGHEEGNPIRIFFNCKKLMVFDQNKNKIY